MAVAVAVAVLVAVGVGVLVGVGSALTGRRGSHSTAGLAVIPAAVLPVPNLGHVVLERHAQLAEERRVVSHEVRDGDSGAWLRSRLGALLRHDTESKSGG